MNVCIDSSLKSSRDHSSAISLRSFLDFSFKFLQSILQRILPKKFYRSVSIHFTGFFSKIFSGIFLATPSEDSS